MFRRTVFFVLAAVTLASAAYAAKDWGFTARLRHEYWKNPTDLEDTRGDDRSFYRMKFSLWGQHTFSDTFSGYAKLTNESRSYIIFEGGDSTYQIHEAVFDNLYFDWKKLFGGAVDARIGRQDLLGMYAESFLIGDGTPADGSRTFYFNAAKVAWKVNDIRSVDFLLIGNPKQDDLLPVINEQKTAAGVKTQLNATEDAAFAVFVKCDPTKECHREAYYIYKTETGTPGSLTDTKLNTVGLFIKRIFEPATLRGQLAYQTGDYGTAKRTGLGAYVFVDKSFQAKLSPAASVGYVYLSGDDKTTADNEGFDPLFSRFPLYSEYYAIELARETGAAYWTNLSIIKLQGSIVPCAKSKLTVAYNMMGAPQKGAAVAGTFYGTGTTRGNMITARLDYKFDEQGNITGYLYGEQLAPGDFYASTADAGMFSRAEVQFKF
jgi:hypothetical protein